QFDQKTPQSLALNFYFHRSLMGRTRKSEFRYVGGQSAAARLYGVGRCGVCRVFRCVLRHVRNVTNALWRLVRARPCLVWTVCTVRSGAATDRTAERGRRTSPGAAAADRALSG